MCFERKVLSKRQARSSLCSLCVIVDDTPSLCRGRFDSNLRVNRSCLGFLHSLLHIGCIGCTHKLRVSSKTLLEQRWNTKSTGSLPMTAAEQRDYLFSPRPALSLITFPPKPRGTTHVRNVDLLRHVGTYVLRKEYQERVCLVLRSSSKNHQARILPKIMARRAMLSLVCSTRQRSIMTCSSLLPT